LEVVMALSVNIEVQTKMAAGGAFALGCLTTIKPYNLNLEMLSKAQCA